MRQTDSCVECVGATNVFTTFHALMLQMFDYGLLIRAQCIVHLFAIFNLLRIYVLGDVCFFFFFPIPLYLSLSVCLFSFSCTLSTLYISLCSAYFVPFLSMHLSISSHSAHFNTLEMMKRRCDILIGIHIGNARSSTHIRCAAYF